MNVTSHKILVAAAFFFVFTAVALPVISTAAQYHGRIMTGAYASNEKFSDNSSSGSQNDFATASTRLYLEISRFNQRNWEVVTDLRDKHDFFDKVNRELLTLTATNTFQLRQLSLRMPEKTRGFYGNLGRFPVTDAGAVYTDGAEIGYRFNPDWSSSVFGGLNPKREDQSYVGFNRNSQVVGSYFVYQPSFRSWTNSFYYTNAAVAEINSGQVDRTYWYENLVLQPNSANRIIVFSYLDFVPRLHIQNANANYSRDFNNRLMGNAGISIIDVVEYTRRQGIRERLDPSPYRSASLRTSYRVGSFSSLELSTDHGVRLADGLVFHEYMGKMNFSQFLNRHFSFYLGAGQQRNFTSNDIFIKSGLGYYTDKWEFTFDSTLASESYDSGERLSPVTFELSAAWYISKAIFGTVSLQEASDQRVNILSTFFKLGYRFGTKEIPAVRDGAPPRGRI